MPALRIIEVYIGEDRTQEYRLVNLNKLKKHRAVVLKEKLSKGEEYQDNDLVMCTPFGTPINPASVRRSLNALIQKAVVQKFAFMI
ncbi:DNA integration/recombination/invertion protein [Bacillus cereus ATCC 10876]|nr:DNA integration/recombination/invertion protein [Bacillus cereus ATCC 10876]KFL63698.1 phage integrase family protein [Bacillus cereus ATCC 10876]SUY93870.1 phage integrase family protein [Bacillus cereus]